MIEYVERPGQEYFSSARKIGDLLKNELMRNPHFYFFSPDETTSNKMEAVFESSTRAWNLPIAPQDLPESADGHIIELLSENVLFSVMTGHLMNGESAMLASYECFLPIITSQIIQHLKFIKQSKRVDWRRALPAVNLLSTSTCWRQDHNGFTHQSPALISSLLENSSNLVNCLFPIDDVAVETTFDFMMQSKNVVNLTTFNKTDEPRWIDSHHAKFQFDNGGASIFQFASDENPDFVLTAAGDIVSREALYAIKILKSDLPELRMRFVGINALSHGAIGTTDRKLSQATFDEYFTTNRPIIANFHGYPDTFRNILINYASPSRIHTHGFIEEGSTTTPFAMLTKNHASRYDLAITIAKELGRFDLAGKYQEIIRQNSEHAKSFGIDKVSLTI